MFDGEIWSHEDFETNAPVLTHVQLWICRWSKRLWREKVCWEAFDFNYRISPSTPKRLSKRFDKSFVPAPKFAANLLLLQLKFIGVSTLVRLFLGNTSGQASDNVQSLWFCGAPSQFWNGSYSAAFIVFTAQEQVDQYLHVLAHQEGCFQVHKDQLSDCRAYPCEYTVMTLISQLSLDSRKTKCKKKRQVGTFWVVWWAASSCMLQGIISLCTEQIKCSMTWVLWSRTTLTLILLALFWMKVFGTILSTAMHFTGEIKVNAECTAIPLAVTANHFWRMAWQFSSSKLKWQVHWRS